MSTRILFATTLLLAAPALHAYQIVEGRYRVETSPGVYEDQLVVRCDDGRTLKVAWETRLAEACGEGLMGERLGKTARPAPASAAEVVESAPAAEAAAAPAGGAPAAAAVPTGPLFDEASQREAMLAQLRAQFGNVPERYIEFKPGADGLSMRLLPPLNEIVRKYEACRRAREPGAQCAAVRDQAVAKLNDAPAAATAAPAHAAKPAKAAAAPKAPAKPEAAPVKADAPAAKPEAATAQPDAAAPAEPQPAAAQAPAAEASTAVEGNQPHLVAEPQAAAAARPLPEAAPRPAPAAAQAPLDRPAREQKIAEEHAVCMRLKPKFECEQARARALGALDRPAKAAKPSKPAREAKAGAASQVAAAGQ